jgi:peroxiredoxin
MISQQKAPRVAIVAITIDGPDVNRMLATQLGITLPIAADPAHTAIDAYGVFDGENEIAWPAMFLVEQDGTISWRFVGDTYKVRPTAVEVEQALAPR